MHTINQEMVLTRILTNGTAAASEEAGLPDLDKVDSFERVG
jgi:hypothetical protein